MANRGRPPTRPPIGDSSFVEHLKRVPPEERQRVADYLRSIQIDSYEKLPEVFFNLAAEIALGTISPEIGEAIRLMIESAMASMSMADRLKNTSQATNALGTLAQAIAASQAQRVPVQPSYTTPLIGPTVVDVADALEREKVPAQTQERADEIAARVKAAGKAPVFDHSIPSPPLGPPPAEVVERKVDRRRDPSIPHMRLDEFMEVEDESG